MFFRRKKDREGPPQSDHGTSPAGGSDAGAARAPEGGADLQASTTQFLTGDSGVDRRTVQVLLEAIAELSRHRDTDTLLRLIVDRSIEVTGAERGLLVLSKDGAEEVQGEESSLEVKVARSRGGRELEGDARFSTTIARKVLEDRQPVRATVQSESEALDLGRSVYDLKLRAVMCVPLTAPGTSLDESTADGRQGERVKPVRGVLYVDSRAATRQFSQRDLHLFFALAQQISIALENQRLTVDSIDKVRMQKDLELANAVQRDLMPDVPEDVAGYDLHGWYRPAEETAGDFYDFVKLEEEGQYAVAVGDVTGHGVGPALITAAAQASLETYLEFSSDPGLVMTKLNKKLSARLDDGRFVTLYLGIIDVLGRLVGVNAGHAQPMVWRKASGEVEILGTDGPALGMLDSMEFESAAAVQLEPGDVLVIYTDGLTEARDPADPETFFGEDGLQRVLVQAAGADLSAKEITERLVEETLQMAGGMREDDMTLVVVRRDQAGA